MSAAMVLSTCRRLVIPVRVRPERADRPDPSHASGTPDIPRPAVQRLSRAQEIALDALFNGASNADAAAVAGVTERSIRSWKRQPRFAAELEQVQVAVWCHRQLQLGARVDRALDELDRVIANPDLTVRERLAITAGVIMLDTRVSILLEAAEHRRQLRELRSAPSAAPAPVEPATPDDHLSETQTSPVHAEDSGRTLDFKPTIVPGGLPSQPSAPAPPTGPPKPRTAKPAAHHRTRRR